MQTTGKFRKGLDKYYTAPTVAAACVMKLVEYLGPASALDAQWIEPSAGAGVFVDSLKAAVPLATCLAIDLEPAAAGIETADFMVWEPPAKAEQQQQRIVIGNPPFGSQSSLAVAFMKRAESLGADIIGFILPRSFEKPSLQNRVPAIFELVSSTRVAQDAFLVNGEPYDVPCCFQLWRRAVEARPRVVAVSPTLFTYVKKEELHHIVIRRVGVYAGRAYRPDPKYSVQSHYFIRLGQPLGADAVNWIMSELSEYPFSTSTVGPRSISKQELTPVLEPLLQEAVLLDALPAE
jgi:hypothetical protein